GRRGRDLGRRVQGAAAPGVRAEGRHRGRPGAIRGLVSQNGTTGSGRRSAPWSARMNIAVVGTGYVGLVTGACFAEFGVSVVGIDKDEKKIASLKEGKVPFFEPGLEELVNRNMKGGRLSFTTDLKAAVEKSLVIFIAVGTPSDGDGAADLKFVREVASGIARHMNGYKVVVTKSTVPTGTGAMIRKLIQEQQKAPHPFSVASNPEFLREGAAIEDFMRPN